MIEQFPNDQDTKCLSWMADIVFSLQWRHNERDGVWNHRRLDRLVKAQITEIIKAHRYWPFRGESTGDRWIPLTKDQ